MWSTYISLSGSQRTVADVHQHGMRDHFDMDGAHE